MGLGLERTVPPAWASAVPLWAGRALAVAFGMLFAFSAALPFAALLAWLAWGWATPLVACLALAACPFKLPDSRWAREACAVWFKTFDLHDNFRDVEAAVAAAVATGSRGEDGGRRRPLIVCMHPHGTIPLHAFIWGAWTTTRAPPIDGVGAEAAVLERWPVLRQVFELFGGRPAGHRELMRRLLDEPETPVLILADGVAGVFHCCADDDRVETVLVHRRRGLFRLALETDAVLLVVFVFGASRLYPLLVGFPELSRRLRAALAVVWPVPRPTRLSFAFGEPFVAERRSAHPPTEREVDAVEEQYLVALRQAFDCKAAAGFPDSTLRVVHL